MVQGGGALTGGRGDGAEVLSQGISYQPWHLTLAMDFQTVVQCSSLLPVIVMIFSNKNQLSGEKGLFQLTGHSPSWREPREGT